MPESSINSNVIGEADAAAVMAVLGEISLHDGAESSILWQAGDIRWQGPVTHRIYNAWSCTKSFTSLCTGLMVDDGKLEIDIPATEYLPELKEKYPDVTLRHLLTFTSGVRPRVELPDPGEKADPFALVDPRFPVGRCLCYSPESEWVGLAVSRVAGKGMAELFRERIGEKIGIDYDYFDWKVLQERDGLTLNGASGGYMAGVHTSAENLLLVGRLLLQNGEWNGEQLVSRAWLDEARTSQKLAQVPPWDALEGWYRDWLPGTYGLHMWVNGVKLNGQRLWPSGSEKIHAAQGNRNQICMVIPECDAILVRMGDDGVIPMQQYDLVIQKLKEYV